MSYFEWDSSLASCLIDILIYFVVDSSLAFRPSSSSFGNSSSSDMGLPNYFISVSFFLYFDTEIWEHGD